METFDIIGIDPGTTTIGVSIFKVSLPKLEIVKIDTILIDLSLFKNDDYLTTNLFFRLQLLSNRISAIMDEYKPLAFAMENGFINVRRINAFGPLIQAVGAMEMAAVKYDPYIRIFKYPPSVVKNAVGAKGNAGKDDVFDSVMKVKEFKGLIDPTVISEHEVDALAVTWALLKEIKNNDVLLAIL